MTGSIDARLAELGISIPDVPKPVAAYIPFVQSGNLIFISGQISRRADGTSFTGKLGDSVSVEDGYQAARVSGINIIAVAKAACDDDLDRVRRIIRLGGYVNSTPDFTDHPAVINGASELMAEVFGPEVSAHSRAAVGMSSLPLGVAVEIDAIIEIA